jgi:hypothetical protein
MAARRAHVGNIRRAAGADTFFNFRCRHWRSWRSVSGLLEIYSWLGHLKAGKLDSQDFRVLKSLRSYAFLPGPDWAVLVEQPSGSP